MKTTPIVVVPGSLGAIKQALNASGWLDDEVIAAGELRQGKALTIAGMVTGAAVVELLRPRRSKALPGQFVLAATADRVIAFKASGNGGSEGVPYSIKIKPGEQATWPRGSVRIVDLAEGGRSRSGTLVLDALERLPVARSGFDRDPDTDELLDLLGDGPVVAAALSPREERYREDQQDLRRASAERPGDFRELAADAVRGRPDVDLSGWAARRGLRFRGATAQGGHLSVTCPWSTDLLFNVVRGRWPGGTDGIVCHEARVYGESARGFFHPREWSNVTNNGNGSRILNAVDVIADLAGHPLPLLTGGSGASYFKVPYTCAGARVPHVAAVTGLHVARRAERYTSTDALFGTWESRPLDDPRLADQWMVAVRKHSDEATVERLVRGPIADLLSDQQGLGFEIRIEYGQVVVSRQDFLKRDADLDALVGMTETLAQAVRDICVRPRGVHGLATPVPAPQWLAEVRRRPGKKHTLWPIGALLDRVVQVADERGMEVEDPRTFHAAFPDLNFPGEAFGVLHGRLPGTALWGRLLCCAERPMVLPDDYRRFLTDPGGPAGSDVAVVAVSPDAPATDPEGEVDGDLRVAVADGVLTAWRLRRSWQPDGAALDRLAADVAAVMRRRGLG